MPVQGNVRLSRKPDIDGDVTSRPPTAYRLPPTAYHLPPTPTTYHLPPDQPQYFDKAIPAPS